MKADIPNIKKHQAAFERYVSHTASRETAVRYGKALGYFFDYFQGKTEPGDFGKLDILDYRAYRRKKGVGASTCNYDIQVVRRFWNWMMECEITGYNPTNAINKLKAAEVARYSFGDAEQGKMYDVCLDDLERLLVGLALTTGLRGKTLAALEKRDFDIGRLMLVVPPEKMKTDTALELPLREKEIALVDGVPEGRIFGDWAKTDRALTYRWNRICKRAGLALRGIRTARRSCATHLLRSGRDVGAVAQWLGHKKIATTMKYVTPASNAASRAALGTFPGGV